MPLVYTTHFDRVKCQRARVGMYAQAAIESQIKSAVAISRVTSMKITPKISFRLATMSSDVANADRIHFQRPLHTARLAF